MTGGGVKAILIDVGETVEHSTFVGASSVPHFLIMLADAVPGPTAETALTLKVYVLPCVSRELLTMIGLCVAVLINQVVPLFRLYS